jgi:hypothetical protein
MTQQSEYPKQSNRISSFKCVVKNNLKILNLAIWKLNFSIAFFMSKISIIKIPKNDSYSLGFLI